jgi:hypothetical protein
MNPHDPDLSEERGSRDWITQIWEYIIRKDLGMPVDEPEWFSKPAMVKRSISTWNLYQAMEPWNRGKDYQDQIKPHNFLMTPVAAVSFATEALRLIAPYSSDADSWLNLRYRNLYDPDGPEYMITTDDKLEMMFENGGVVRVRSYRDVVNTYLNHPEEKFSDANGNSCRYDTRGVLSRKHMRIVSVVYIGKESNALSERESGAVPRADMPVVVDYGSRRDDFRELAVPILETIGTRELSRRIGVSKSTIGDVLRERYDPRPALKAALIEESVREAVRQFGIDLPSEYWSEFNFARQEWREVPYAWHTYSSSSTLTKIVDGDRPLMVEAIDLREADFS